MIRVKRAPCPDCLEKRAIEFVEDDYKNEAVKSTLLTMQHGKCCYCERNLSDLPHTEREVDHYVPKSAFKDGNGNIQWHLANKWDNLLLSCRSCNSKKGAQPPYNKVTRQREIIDPSVTDVTQKNISDSLLMIR